SLEPPELDATIRRLRNEPLDAARERGAEQRTPRGGRYLPALDQSRGESFRELSLAEVVEDRGREAAQAVVARVVGDRAERRLEVVSPVVTREIHSRPHRDVGPEGPAREALEHRPRRGDLCLREAIEERRITIGARTIRKP